MQIKPCDGPFGVEILDVDLRQISDQEIEDCNAEQRQHGVIFFRDQQLSCEDHIDLANRFGTIVVNRFFEYVGEYPQIAMVRKEPQHETAVGGHWHTDHSYDREPARGSILYAKEVPSQGGNTNFINMHLVYESLSEGLKETLQGLQAAHSSRHTFGETAKGLDERFHSAESAVQDNVHPVIIRHPDSGKKVLYVNGDFTTHFVGWTQPESDALLQYLYRFATQPQNILTFKWQKNSIAFWDNRMTWHCANNDYPGERRLMHRITLEGSPLQSALH